MSDARVLYDRIATGTLEYMMAIQAFCAGLPPQRATLSPALALERLTFRLVPSYRSKLASALEAIEVRVKELEASSTRR